MIHAFRKSSLRLDFDVHKPGRRPIAPSLFRLAYFGRGCIRREADFDPGATSISTKKMPPSTSYLPPHSGYLIVIESAAGHGGNIPLSFSHAKIHCINSHHLTMKSSVQNYQLPS